jgi:hypothetical protein
MMLQRIFGFAPRDHRLDVPDDIRQASHALSNEATKLKAVVSNPELREDCLRDLVANMQDKLQRRGH